MEIISAASSLTFALSLSFSNSSSDLSNSSESSLRGGRMRGQVQSAGQQGRQPNTSFRSADMGPLPLVAQFSLRRQVLARVRCGGAGPGFGGGVCPRLYRWRYSPRRLPGADVTTRLVWSSVGIQPIALRSFAPRAVVICRGRDLVAGFLYPDSPPCAGASEKFSSRRGRAHCPSCRVMLQPHLCCVAASKPSAS